MTHTKGEWYVCDSGYVPTVRLKGSMRLSGVGKGTDVNICQLAASAAIGKEGAKANAQLISAAPDLLEALAVMTEVFCTTSPRMDEGDPNRDLFIKIANQAELALAKAKGVSV